jgi:hypothetical protein
MRAGNAGCQPEDSPLFHVEPSASRQAPRWGLWPSLQRSSGPNTSCPLKSVARSSNSKAKARAPARRSTWNRSAGFQMLLGVAVGATAPARDPPMDHPVRATRDRIRGGVARPRTRRINDWCDATPRFADRARNLGDAQRTRPVVDKLWGMGCGREFRGSNERVFTGASMVIAVEVEGAEPWAPRRRSPQRFDPIQRSIAEGGCLVVNCDVVGPPNHRIRSTLRRDNRPGCTVPAAPDDRFASSGNGAPLTWYP